MKLQLTRHGYLVRYTQLEYTHQNTFLILTLSLSHLAPSLSSAQIFTFSSKLLRPKSVQVCLSLLLFLAGLPIEWSNEQILPQKYNCVIVVMKQDMLFCVPQSNLQMSVQV